MLARLGNVIYWASCGASALAFLAALAVVMGPGDEAPKWIMIYILSGIGIWLAGRAIRYILAAK